MFWGGFYIAVDKQNTNCVCLWGHFVILGYLPWHTLFYCWALSARPDLSQLLCPHNSYPLWNRKQNGWCFSICPSPCRSQGAAGLGPTASHLPSNTQPPDWLWVPGTSFLGSGANSRLSSNSHIFALPRKLLFLLFIECITLIIFCCKSYSYFANYPVYFYCFSWIWYTLSPLLVLKHIKHTTFVLGVMVNFTHQLDWVKGCPDSW